MFFQKMLGESTGTLQARFQTTACHVASHVAGHFPLSPLKHPHDMYVSIQFLGVEILV